MIQENKLYNCSIGNRGALINETKQIFKLHAQGLTLLEIRKKVMEENVLGKRYLARLKDIYEVTKRRYFNQLNAAQLSTLSAFLNSKLNEAAKDSVLFFHLCRFDQLLFDFTTSYVFQKYENGAAGISKLDFEAFLKQQERSHPEIQRWSAYTRAKLGRGVLAALADFNLLKGSKQKEFKRVYLSLEAFLYLCYYLKDSGLSPKEIINSSNFRLYLLDKDDVIALFSEATKRGYLEFNYQGDIYNLKFACKTLKEFVDAITRDPSR